MKEKAFVDKTNRSTAIENKEKVRKVSPCLLKEEVEEIEKVYPYEEYLNENIEEIYKETETSLERLIDPGFKI